MNATRTYFIRTRNRNRILATLVTRIVDGKLVFGLSRAAREESSPSRKIGRQIALDRLEKVASTGTNLYSPSYRRNEPTNSNHLLIGGILPLEKVVPTLNAIVNGYETFDCIPTWAREQDAECFGDDHRAQYLDMFCKIRNSVEKGSW